MTIVSISRHVELSLLEKVLQISCPWMILQHRRFLEYFNSLSSNVKCHFYDIVFKFLIIFFSFYSQYISFCIKLNLFLYAKYTMIAYNYNKMLKRNYDQLKNTNKVLLINYFRDPCNIPIKMSHQLTKISKIYKNLTLVVWIKNYQNCVMNSTF